jgi:hypothetical protein
LLKKNKEASNHPLGPTARSAQASTGPAQTGQDARGPNAQASGRPSNPEAARPSSAARDRPAGARQRPSEQTTAQARGQGARPSRAAWPSKPETADQAARIYAEMTPQFYETTPQSRKPYSTESSVSRLDPKKTSIPVPHLLSFLQNRARRREPNRRPNRRRQRHDGDGEQHVGGGPPAGEPHQDMRGLRQAAARAKLALGSLPA